MPLPESAITCGELAALLLTVTLPATLPVAVGANRTLNEADCPAARVSGSAKPLSLNPPPLALICEMEMLELPVFDSVTLCVALVPVVRLPKFNDAGLTESCSVAAMPVPPTETASGELGALLISVTLPAKLLAEAGAKPTVNEDEPPGATESGSANPDKLKPVPASDAWVTLRIAVPGFRMVRVWVLVTPTVTLPKLTLEGTTEICGCTPVPLSAIVAGELVAVLTTLMLPETLPAEAGAKLAVIARLCPVAKGTAPEKPVTLNPAPVAAT